MKSLLFLVGFLPALVLCQPQYEWAYGLGGPEDDYIADVITDEFGNVYLTGSFMDYISYDTTLFAISNHDTLTNLFEDDAFIMKLSPSGRLLWHKQFGEYGFDTGLKLALSDAGELFWGGTFTFTADFGNDSLTMKDTSGYGGIHGADIFVAKLDSSTGTTISLLQLAGDGKDELQLMTIDNDGYLWLGGYTQSDSLQLGEDHQIGPWRLFLARFTPDGTLLWSRQEQVGTDPLFSKSFITSYSTDQENSLHFTVEARDSLTLGGQLIFSQRGYAWITINSEGQVKFWKDLSSNPGKLCIDSQSNVFLAGIFQDSVRLDSIKMIGGSKDNVYLSRWTKNGEINWATFHRFSSIGFVNQIVSNNDRLYVLGDMYGNLILNGSDTLLTYGLFDGYLLRYDFTGNLLWGKQIGSFSDDFLNNISIGSEREIYTIGSFYSNATILDSIFVYNTLGGVDRFEFWIGKMMDSIPLVSSQSQVLGINVKVFPNPFREQIFIQNLPLGNWNICVTDPRGKVVYQSIKNVWNPSKEAVVNINSSLVSGMYYMLVHNDKQSFSFKIFSY